jgi:hypothetical protein
MALINENIKQNLANNFVANYDETDEGTGVNGQPLQVDQNGLLNVNVQTGQLNGKMFAYNVEAGQTFVECDQFGQLDLGGTKVLPIINDGDAFCIGEEYSSLPDALSGLLTLKLNLLGLVNGGGYRRMYNYSESIFSHGGKVNVVLSCYGNS